MGANSSCHVFGFTESEIKDAPTEMIKMTTDEKAVPDIAKSYLAKVAQVRAEERGPSSPKTIFNSSRDTLKALKTNGDGGVAHARWNQAKAEWEARVLAEMEERERQSQAPGTDADRYGADERRLALQAIKEEQVREEEECKHREAQDESQTMPIVTDSAAQEVAAQDQLEEQQRCEEHLQCVDDHHRPAPEADYGEDRKQEDKDAAERRLCLDNFLAKNGFAGVNVKRHRSLRRNIYPMHLAAEQGDAKIVVALLEAGADVLQKDSGSRTPADVARKKNRKGSHDEVLKLLSSA
jgi:hypothetical protein